MYHMCWVIISGILLTKKVAKENKDTTTIQIASLAHLAVTEYAGRTPPVAPTTQIPDDFWLITFL